MCHAIFGSIRKLRKIYLLHEHFFQANPILNKKCSLKKLNTKYQLIEFIFNYHDIFDLLHIFDNSINKEPYRP